ncbi:MAG: glycosyltransferase family 4 protein, partial [Firmicutes bacterium]|nr:glycosyltransferase family 4 protein [Bacillota bacterium]
FPPGQQYLKEELRGIERVWIKTPPYRGNGPARLLNHLAFAWRTAGLGSAFAPPDAVIGSSPHLLAALAAWRLARNHRLPFIFEIRDIWPQSLVDAGALSRFSPLAAGMGLMEKWLCRKAALIISALPGGAEHVAALDLGGNKVVYIPNGVDLGWFDQCAREGNFVPVREAPWRRKGSVVFTYAGAHGYANGLETVVAAAGILQSTGKEGIHVLLAGEGPCSAGLRRMARDAGLTNITFLGAIDKDLVPPLLTQTDVCLFHLRNSRAYRFGLSSNKLFDYMAAARPLIAAVDVPLDPAFKNFCLQVPSDDPASLARAMLQMAKRPPGRRAEMGLFARRYVERYHDVTVLAGKLAETLERIVP